MALAYPLYYYINLFKTQLKKNEKMAFSAVTTVTNCCKSGVSDSTVHARKHELDNHNDPRDHRDNRDHYLWVCIKQMVRRQHNTYLNVFRRNSRFRLGIQYDDSWFRLYSGNRNQSSKSSLRSHRDRKRNRNYFYYGLIISILAIGNPSYAEEGETNNTSNPVAAATGNVTNQAVQFQNNGAPSRQVLGPNISCNGATMTFSPFYMGNHTTPFDDAMDQQSYTVAENWGAQINFMVPLDGSLIERCKSIAAKQEAKMALDYELVRVKNCAELQQKGFMIRPGTRVYHMCSDVIPIAAFKKQVAAALAKKNPPPPKKWYQNLNPFSK